MQIQKIYEDNHLLIVNKPVNIPVQEDSSGDLDLLNMLKKDIKIRYNKPGKVFLGLVHRLDRPVGGIIVFARTSKAASRLSDQLRKKVFHKKYLAIIQGKPSKRSGKYTDYLIKNKVKNTVKVTRPEIKNSKKAELSYQLIETRNNFSLVEINLITGRPHQIRVQFASRGTPVYGDFKYGEAKEGDQIGLWAEEISFEHPIRKEKVIFNCPPPLVPPWDRFYSTEQ